VEDGKLSSENLQKPASVMDAGVSPASLPTLLIVTGEPLTETHKDAIVKRIATGEVLRRTCFRCLTHDFASNSLFKVGLAVCRVWAPPVPLSQNK